MTMHAALQVIATVVLYFVIGALLGYHYEPYGDAQVIWWFIWPVLLALDFLYWILVWILMFALAVMVVTLVEQARLNSPRRKPDEVP